MGMTSTGEFEPAQKGAVVDEHSSLISGSRKAVFLDLQGTLGGDGLGDILDFSFYPCAIPAIRLLNQTSLLSIVVTNQSHIANGLFTYQEFERRMADLRRELDEAGARIDAVYCCPHGDDDGCTCQKPRPGMLLQAQRDHGLLLSSCYVVGDAGAWDMVLARASGCRAILVRAGLGETSLGRFRNTWVGVQPDFIARNVLAAAEWIADMEARGK